MPLEWVGAVTTAAVGITGLGATLWAQRQARDHATTLAREARSQDRIEAAYRRILENALETTEFVTGADVIFIRDAKPPDVDVETYDIPVLLRLYASDAMCRSYDDWATKLATARDVLDKVPEKETWYETKVPHLRTEFRDAVDGLQAALDHLIDTARGELR